MNVNEAIEYLKGQDLMSMEAGKYPVDDDFYYMVQEYTTKVRSEAKLEAHEKWIDIQWMLKGTEIIETEDISRLTVKEAYNPEKDVTFYEKPEVMSKTVLTDGAYVVLYPQNGHMPQVAVDEKPLAIKKVVAKVRVK